MTRTRIGSFVFAAGVAVLTSPAWAQHHHEGDIIVGRSGSTGQLTLEFDEWAEEHALPPISGVRNGYLGEAPGFDHLEDAEPEEDFYPLEEGAEIYFEIMSFEDAFQAWDGLAGPYSTTGTQILLGDDHLHAHLDWHINSDDPAFDLGQSPWEAQFRLIDLGTTGYTASDTYTLNFIPEPASLSLLAFGAVAALRRRTA